jgi:PIN domain nuclease of toxin-antitoxin system
MLLDTHALLWYLSDDPQLPPAVRETIVQQPLVYVSAAVIWEIAIKGSLGKLSLSSRSVDSRVAVEQIITECTAQGFEFLNITPEHAAQAPFLMDTHKDPFDRLLAAQALEQDLMLVSCDRAFDIAIPKIRRLWADDPSTGPAVRKGPKRAAKKPRS